MTPSQQLQNLLGEVPGYDGKEHRFSVRGLEEWIAEQRAVKITALALPPTRRQS